MQTGRMSLETFFKNLKTMFLGKNFEKTIREAKFLAILKCGLFRFLVNSYKGNILIKVLVHYSKDLRHGGPRFVFWNWKKWPGRGLNSGLRRNTVLCYSSLRGKNPLFRSFFHEILTWEHDSHNFENRFEKYSFELHEPVYRNSWKQSRTDRNRPEQTRTYRNSREHTETSENIL
jgi:hypothetical protein